MGQRLLRPRIWRQRIGATLAVSEHKENLKSSLGLADNTSKHLAGERPAGKIRAIPEVYRNIQVNFCKKPGCPNFCVEPQLGPSRKGRQSGSDGYRLTGAKAESALKCNYCGVESRIKSNRAIYQEFRRQAAPLFAPSPLTCPTEGCLSDPRKPTQAFQKFGKSTGPDDASTSNPSQCVGVPPPCEQV